jgi:carbamoyltransferase
MSATAVPIERMDHHFAHACAAFLPSQFDAAAIVVCDEERPEVSVWAGNGTTVATVDWPWNGAGFATLYSQCAEVFVPDALRGREQRMEALARLDPCHRDARLERLFCLAADRLELTTGWQTCIGSWIDLGRCVEQAASLASAAQVRIGDLLIEFLRDVKRLFPEQTRLCIGGSLFQNSYFNTRIKCCGVFEEVFVPINPANAGLAAGVGLNAGRSPKRSVSAFLGPSYSSEEVKATLDNCKLSYDRVSESDAIGLAVDNLHKGRLVAWFDGAMEWGPRALGGRSILANPFAPFVLENLNGYLKKRDAWRGYALSGLESAVRELFNGPPSSPFMECDFVPKDGRQFSHVLPGRKATARIQTVGRETPRKFQALLHAFGGISGVPILVNTSFNGFQEPIVCSPRDAVRVFFGTGIDVLIIGEFVITK